MVMARGSIDWEKVRRQLASSELALERTRRPEAARVAAIYRERAARLARRNAPAEGAGAPAVLVVRVGEERYALELGEVVAVIAGQAGAPVPGSRGPAAAVNLRGDIRPVWDLAALLGSPRGEAGRGCIVVVRRGGGVAGLRVDGAEQIREMEQADWAPAAEGAPHAKGMSADLVALLDPGNLWEEESA